MQEFMEMKRDGLSTQAISKSHWVRSEDRSQVPAETRDRAQLWPANSGAE